MGHFHDKVTATGKDRQDAEQNAIADFYYEHGHRYDIREVVSAVLIRKVPPMKTVTEVRGRNEYISSQPDPTAPESEWLEEWEFVLHSHA